MREQMDIIDMLSILCCYITIETMNDNRILEEHLKKQDEKMDKIIEVLKNDSK